MMPAFCKRSLSLLAWIAPLLLFVLHFAHTVALRHLLTALVLLALAGQALHRAGPSLPLRAPVLAWLGFTLLSCLWSVAPQHSAKAWLDEAFYPMLLFCAFHALGGEAKAEARIRLAAWSGMVALAALSMAGYRAVSADMFRPGVLNFYPGVGQASTYAVLALPIFVLLLSSREKPWPQLGTVGLLACVIVGAVSLNRMFWPVAVATVLCTLAVYFRRPGRKGLLLTVAGVVAIITVMAGVQHLRDTRLFAARQAAPVSVTAELKKMVDSDPRPTLWRAWYARALEHPWIGVGFGKDVPRSYHQPRHTEDKILQHLYFGVHAHNLFLNTVLQTGVLGLGLLLWLLGSLASSFGRAYHRQPELASVGLALVLAMILKNSTDDFMRDSMAMYFWALAGWMLSKAHVDSAARAPITERT